MRTFAQKPKATQQTTSAKPMISGRAHFGQSREVNSILHLQRTIGNQALQRLLQANPDDLEARSITNEVARFSYDFSQTPVHPRSLASAQAKLTVNSPGDIYEQEADRLSEQVVRMPVLRLQTAPRPVDSQKLAGPERQPMPGKRLDAHDSEPESEPSIIQEVRASAGQPLPAEARNFMESRFGHSFSNVRVHANGAAGDLAHRLHARAFTIGDRIFFAPGEYQPDRTSGKRLLAHELTHVLQQGNTSRQSQHVQRDGPSCAPEPEWASPSWAGPLPGDPVPGYEQPRDAYTESDRRMFLIALDERIKENHRTAGEFLGDYGSALVDLWAKYATETMAEEAEKSQWSWWGKRLAWVIQESLIVLSGAGALRWLGKGVVETTKLMTSFAADVGFNAAESAGADVPAVRAAIDAKTGELAKELKKHTVDFIGDLEIGTFHANWLGEHKDNLTELVLFRIPPAVPRIPAADVRAAVAQAVVGFLYGEGAALPQYEHVLAMELDPDLLAPFLLPLSSRHARLKTSRILKGELYGRQIKDMPNVPLSITLASSQNPVDVVRASLGLPEPSPPDLGEFNKDWKPTLQPKPTIIGDISIDDFVRAYPDKPPAKISRDASGDVMVIGGGVLEQLYLYYWANRGSGKGLESVVRDIEEQRLSRNLESAELGTSSESEMLSPETLAAEVETQLYPSQQAGAEALISDAIESWYLKG